MKIITCVCEEEVRCEGFTTTCNNCGRDYNWAGQLLAPRSCWGEETGEHWSECVGPCDCLDDSEVG